MIKIDCHTHIVNEAIAREYFKRTDNYAIVMEMAPSIMPCPDCVDTVINHEKLFLSPVIDLKCEIKPQLERIRAHIDEWKVVGLKIFLTYQKGRANDDKLMPVYEFAAKYKLTVTYHTGLPSLVLPCDNDMEGSRALYIKYVAKIYEDVNFVAAHLDDPRFNECIDIMYSQPNIYSDFSGAYETGTKEGNDVEGAIKTFGAAIHSRPGMENRILYGTDFCPPINLSQLDEYDISIKKIFDEKYHDLIYYKNCMKVFPRLRRFIDYQENT